MNSSPGSEGDAELLAELATGERFVTDPLVRKRLAADPRLSQQVDAILAMRESLGELREAGSTLADRTPVGQEPAAPRVDVMAAIAEFRREQDLARPAARRWKLWAAVAVAAAAAVAVFVAPPRSDGPPPEDPRLGADKVQGLVWTPTEGFSWPPQELASYEVTIVDLTRQPVASSGRLMTPRWRPILDSLPRQFRWRVTVRHSDGRTDTSGWQSESR
ncbi:MAG: hypothetical protein MUC36_21740 [Planctomycetes bacterium]|jgi:hypothetical protein|nr:hypothetical protein [Planctomycetota bacterium]